MPSSRQVFYPLKTEPLFYSSILSHARMASAARTLKTKPLFVRKFLNQSMIKSPPSLTTDNRQLPTVN
jgi:hypothetical protein